MFQLIKDLVSGFAAMFRFKEKKQELENSPQMQANAQARMREEIRQDTTKAVSEQNDDAIRKGLAE